MKTDSSLKLIMDHLSPYCGDDDHVRSLLGLSLGRVLVRAKAEGRENWRNLISTEQIVHIVDWLKASIINNEPWLLRLDEEGRPKKLMKFSSVEQIGKEADRAMFKSAQKSKGIKLAEGDEELVAKLEGDFYLVKLLTPKALDHESSVMQHCIGSGAYDSALSSGKAQFLSLRDMHGKAHVTLEVRNNVITQFQGKQNTVPRQRYILPLMKFIQDQRYGVSVNQSQLGYVIDTDYNWHSFDNLPAELNVSGDLTIENVNLKTFPKALKVGGNFKLYRCAVDRLSDELTVGGDLTFSNTEIEFLPPNLNVRGSITLENSGVKELPSNLIVNGDFIVNHSEISSLPCDLKVYGCLDIAYTKISRLPDNLEVGSSVYFGNSPITELSEGMKIGGSLDLRYTNVKILPRDITIEGDLLISDKSNIELPDCIPDDKLIYVGRRFCSAGAYRKDYAELQADNQVGLQMNKQASKNLSKT